MDYIELEYHIFKHTKEGDFYKKLSNDENAREALFKIFMKDKEKIQAHLLWLYVTYLMNERENNKLFGRGKLSENEMRVVYRQKNGTTFFIRSTALYFKGLFGYTPNKIIADLVNALFHESPKETAKTISKKLEKFTDRECFEKQNTDRERFKGKITINFFKGGKSG